MFFLEVFGGFFLRYIEYGILYINYLYFIKRIVICFYISSILNSFIIFGIFLFLLFYFCIFIIIKFLYK